MDVPAVYLSDEKKGGVTLSHTHFFVSFSINYYFVNQ